MWLQNEFSQDENTAMHWTGPTSQKRDSAFSRLVGHVLTAQHVELLLFQVGD